ncbi:preprotein translocase subunit SecA [Enemella sp. A6]|uniref:preprotein translocase subunit SecA n=1 Tax=Enemella sp. A6 TaxID=3440152 RepID=UPI003EBE3960
MPSPAHATQGARSHVAFLDKLLNFGEGRVLRRLEGYANRVNSIEEDFLAMDDDELRGQTADFRQRLENGEPLEDLLPEAFATVREASRRVLGKRHFDVQLMGGAALHLGNIAEMKTGEGKTLVATLPSYLNGLTGKGVHVVTVNDYLAEYQSEQMGRVHKFLGLETSSILSRMTPAERRKAYAADITYGTNNEFGFDYLRDNMAHSLADCVQRGHHFAIVDEVDSILVDEARTPLIISGPAEDSHRWYPEFARMAERMKRDTHYEVDEKKRTVSILEPGIDMVEDRLGIDNLYESANTPLISYLNNAIKAKELFANDKDYVVTGEGEVLIVDEHTGRTLPGRRYNEGLHQAIEAKEKVEIRDEYQTLATITLQNYFRMYDKLGGMTGTAKTEESEFQKIYGLSVVQIPTNRPMIREDLGDLIFRTEEAKFDAIVADVKERHDRGQPVLMGTASVAKSEVLSAMLKRAGVPHNVLNAKHHASEADIVALAGRKGAVTVATNMAGRGTDIILGGNAEHLAHQKLRESGLDPLEDPEAYEAAWPDTLAAFEEQTAVEHEEVVELGGLYVIGSERHDSRRIDNQLRGRSGRQGDPGESRFYLSLGDDLLRRFRPEVIEWALRTFRVPDDQPLEDKSLSKAIQNAQKQVESQNFEIRKNILKYDDVMNRQRHAIYSDRRKVLEGADVEAQMRQAVESTVAGVVRQHTQGFSEDWELETLWTEMATLYPVTLKRAEYEDTDISPEELIEDFQADAIAAYDAREAELGAENMRELERRVLLTVLDRKWREHLYEMDYLREGIGLRAMAQRDPLVEYQREGGDMFNAMMAALSEEVVGYLFNLEVQVQQTPAEQVQVEVDGDGKPLDAAALAALVASGARAVSEDAPKAKATAGATSKSGGTGSKSSSSASKAGTAVATPPTQPTLQAKGLETKERPLAYSAPGEDGTATRTGGPSAGSGNSKPKSKADDPYAGVGRNQPCPCGSGKKFKMCHGR